MAIPISMAIPRLQNGHGKNNNNGVDGIENYISQIRLNYMSI